jgi:predicted O-methyltransferase YrrM
VLDEAVREVLARLEREDAEERAQGLPSEQRSRAVAPTTGQFLFSLVAPQTGCEVLELGGSRGYSSIWLGAGVRYLGGRVVSIERAPEAAERWRANVRDAGLEEWVELIEADALDVLQELEDIFDVVFIDAEKSQYEHYFAPARQRVEPGGLIVADNVLSHKETLEPYSRARQSDPTLVSTTVPLDRGWSFPSS